MNLVENLGLIAVLGAVNYWFINYFDIIDFFDRNQTDEKYSFWIVLGVVNFSIVYFLLMTPLKHQNHYFVYILSLFVSFVINFLLVKAISKLKGYFLSENKTAVSFRTVLVNALDEYGDCKKLCHIFDFDGNLIEHGWIEHYPSDNKDETVFSLQLDPPGKDEKNIYENFSEFRNNLSNNENVRVIIDMENRIKIYIEFHNI